MHKPHFERHYYKRIGWLRAAVLGANDGIVSTASLVIGVAAAGADRGEILIAGVAGLIAGAMSMAAGEYVSVSSQADTEAADLAREKKELESDPQHELEELTRIYIKRGLEPGLAKSVAEQLTAHDALGAHIRDEHGITETHRAYPLQAAVASAITFAMGALFPVLLACFVPVASMAWTISGCSLFFLSFLGAIAARAGGARVITGILRVTFWGAFAMGLTAWVGTLFGAGG